MANTFKFGNGEWAVGKETALAYNDENSNFKPLPFTFDRASTATVVNKQGLIETVGVDEPRIDFLNNTKGHLLLEPLRRNLIPYSQDVNSWATKTNITVSSNNAVSPDGTQNADKLISTANFARIREVFSLQAGTTYTVSFYVKNISAVNPRLQVYDYTNSTALKTVYYGSLLTNEWQRLEYQFTTTTAASVNLEPVRDLNLNEEILLWGVQLEDAGSGNSATYPTSYIPTQGSAVTRSAESCYQDNLLTDIINASYPFTMYAEAKAVFDSTQHFLTFGNRGISNQYFTLVLNSDGTVKLDARANGISENINSSATAITNGNFFKAAVTMESATSGKISVNGVLDSKTNFTLQAINSSINDLLVGMLRTASDTGRRIPVKDVKLYNTALTDAELIQLTS